MNFKISKNRFYDALQIVARAIAPNSPVPALSGIKMDAFHDQLTLTGSDADISIQMVLSNAADENLGLTILEEGSIVIDYRYLLEIVRKIDSEEISIEILDGTFTRFSAGRSEFKINGIRPEDYPTVDFTIPANQFKIKSSLLSQIIEETSFAANSKETRLILTGVNLHAENGSLICTATDSYRLAKKTVPVECEPFNVTILAKSLNNVRSIFTSAENEITVALSDKKAQFSSANIILQTRMLDGSYPDTDRLIPAEFTHKLVISRHALIAAIDRSSFIRNDNMMIVRLQINTKDDITLTNKSQEIGESHEELAAESYEGEPLDISFSGNYVSDAAKILTTENIVISFTGEMRPFILSNDRDGDQSILQLVLPVRTYN